MKKAKCKDYKKKKGKNCCKNFLGHRTIKIEDLVSGKGEHEMKVFESCVYRCKLAKKVQK